MVKLSVCIETLFPELSFEERIRKVAELGFEAFEFWFIDHWFDGKNLIPQGKDIEGIATTAKEHGSARLCEE